GELQSLIARVFCDFALTEGIALEGAHNADIGLSQLETFQGSKVAPLMREFSAMKEEALMFLSQTKMEMDTSQANSSKIQKLLEGNETTVSATQSHLASVRGHLTTLNS